MGNPAPSITPVVCIFHNSDMDGHCAGAVVRHKFPDAIMLGMNYGDEVEWDKIPMGSIVYMVDFCLEDYMDMEALVNNAKEVYWYGHHTTALNNMEQHGLLTQFTDWICEPDAPIGACEQTWLKLHPGKDVPTVVKMCSRYDVWDLDDDVLAFQYGMKLYPTWPTGEDSERFWYDLLSPGVRSSAADLIKSQGEPIYKYLQLNWERRAKHSTFTVEIQGVRFLACNNGPNSSSSLDSVFDPEIHDAFLIFYWTGSKKEWRFSMYSNKDNVDLGSIASSFGGGGKEKAAGFAREELPDELATIMLAK